MPGAVVHVATRDYVVATWQSVLVLVWRIETTVPGITAAEEVYDELAARHRPGVFLLNIVEPNARMPASDVRTKMAAFLADRAHRMILSAVVHEGTGFRAAAVRSVVTGLALVTKLPYRHKIFSSVEEASGWFAANAPVARAFGAVALVEAVADLRHRAAAAATG